MRSCRDFTLYFVFFLSLLLGGLGHASDRADMHPVAIARQEQDSLRISKMTDLIDQHNRRFDQDGNFIATEKENQKFANSQDEFIKEMKKVGGAQKILFVGNDASKRDFLTIFALTDVQGQLIGLVIEKLSYKDDFYRGILRVFPLSSLASAQGQVLIGLKEYPALLARLEKDTSGDFQLNLLATENLKKGKFVKLVLGLKKTQQQWQAFDLDQQKSVRQIYVRTWMELLPPNGGMKSIQMDSRGKVDEEMNVFTEQENHS